MAIKLKTYKDLREECAKHAKCSECPVVGKVKCVVAGKMPWELPEHLLDQEIMREDMGRWDGFYV